MALSAIFIHIKLALLTAENKWKYSARHGYDLATVRIELEDAHPGYLKILRDYLQIYDVVLVIGSDVIFMNHGVKLESLLQDGDAVLLAEEHIGRWPINNDVMLWRKSARAFALIDRLIADAPKWTLYEMLWQNHLWNLMNAEGTNEAKAACRLVKARTMNSTHQLTESRWQHGDFIIHFMSYGEREKYALAKEYLQLCSGDGCFYPPQYIYNRYKSISKRDRNKIFIALTSDEGITRWETAGFCLQALAKGMPGFQFVVGHEVGTYVPKLRNILAYRAINQTDCGRILFLDADIVPTEQDLKFILSHSDQYPVVGGRYKIKKDGGGFADHGAVNQTPNKDGLISRFEMPTGFLCIDIPLLLAMAEQLHDEIAYVCDNEEFLGKTMHHFFPYKVVNGRLMSEDYHFCHYCHLLGIEVMADTRCQLGHVGTKIYR